SEPLCVGDLLAETNLSHSQLLRIFKEATGTSIHGYIQRRRLARAQQMLHESDMSIHEIAGAVGMPDRRVFNKMFHRETGISPREFRKVGAFTPLQSAALPQRERRSDVPLTQMPAPDSYHPANYASG
ncbi:MAG: helix-turn-helix domain-containing protein, partial [Janthinobacterium lividum]